MLLCAVIDNLIDVKCELLNVAHKWKGVGEALRLHPDLLNNIQADHPTNVTECLSAVLTSSKSHPSTEEQTLGRYDCRHVVMGVRGTCSTYM